MSLLEITNQSADPQCPCYLIHYHNRIYALDCGWDIQYLAPVLPDPTWLSNLPYLSSYDTNDLKHDIVNVNGQLFVNQPPFIVSYSLSHVDWGTVDAIFVSSMGSYLVLPIILRDTGFCGSIYVPSSLHAMGYPLCLSMAALAPSLSPPSLLTSLLHHIPRYRHSEFTAYPMFTRDDVNRLQSSVTTVSFGEEIHRDHTVCITCIHSGHDLASCGWTFQSACSHQQSFDLVYLPSDQLPLTQVTQSCPIDLVTRTKCLLIGRSNRSTEGDIHGLDGLKLFMQQCRNEDHPLLLLCDVNTLLLDILDNVLNGVIGHGKSCSMGFLDDAEGHRRRVLDAYKTHPECLSEPIQHSIFAGMPPFLCFDPNQSNLQFTTLSSRLRQFHLVIDPDLSLRFLFPSSFLTLPETPQIVVVDDRVDLSFLKPFLPDTAGIHQVRFPDSSEGFLRPFQDANVRILRFSDVKSGEKATVPVEKGDLVEVAIKAESSRKRSSDWLKEGLFFVKAAKGREIEVKGRGVAFAKGETADRRVDEMVRKLEEGGVSCEKEGNAVAVNGGKIKLEVEESTVILDE
ncbi:hypothetical protein WA588_005813 [Blastocystis sp. NMH]